jgi:hypothetical protein
MNGNDIALNVIRIKKTSQKMLFSWTGVAGRWRIGVEE